MIEEKKILDDVYQLIKEKPEYYTEIVSIASQAWTKYKSNFNEKETGLDLLLTILVNKKKAKEYLDNRNTVGYLNLDMFPRLEETLKQIAKGD